MADRIAALLDGTLPKVPLDGQVGAGEILPMMHVMSETFTGDFEEGEWMTLVNGSPCSAALVADTALHARHRLENAEVVFALSVEALRAPLEAYDAALDLLWGDEHEAAALRELRTHLLGAETANRLEQQAPVSYRILPRVLGQARRAVAHLEQAARTSLSSAAHNPVFLPPDAEHPGGRLISTGGYHNAMAYPALNALNVAWADLALVAERHVTGLHTAAVSELPNLLALPDAPGSETNLFGWVAAGYVEGARACRGSDDAASVRERRPRRRELPDIPRLRKGTARCQVSRWSPGDPVSRREPGALRGGSVAGSTAPRLPRRYPVGVSSGRRSPHAARVPGRSPRERAVTRRAVRTARVRMSRFRGLHRREIGVRARRGVRLRH